MLNSENLKGVRVEWKGVVEVAGGGKKLRRWGKFFREGVKRLLLSRTLRDDFMT